MSRLSKKQLKELFVTIVSKSGAKCGEGNPFIFEKDNCKCYVFIKNISPAYYPKYPDNSRVQLPTSDRFKKVIKSDLDFLILGYDQNNEVFGAWNPDLIKDRLNAKQNISLYSRFSWQSSVPFGEFTENQLANDEKMLLFKKESLNLFFSKYKELFNLTDVKTVNDNFENTDSTTDINAIKDIINPLLKDHKVLQAVSSLQNTLKDMPDYQGFTFKDYFKIVNEIYKDMYS